MAVLASLTYTLAVSVFTALTKTMNLFGVSILGGTMLEPKNAAERAIIDELLIASRRYCSSKYVEEYQDIQNVFYTEIFTLSEVIKRMYKADNVRVSLIPIRNEKRTLVRVYYSKGDETELILECKCIYQEN